MREPNFIACMDCSCSQQLVYLRGIGFPQRVLFIRYFKLFAFVSNMCLKLKRTIRIIADRICFLMVNDTAYQMNLCDIQL